MLLWGEAEERGFSAPIWMTYKQAQDIGGQVRKGEKGSLVVYANAFTRTETNDRGEDVEREIPFMKGYTLWQAHHNRYYAQQIVMRSSPNPTCHKKPFSWANRPA
jgi:antirestriction protein ArdC